MENIELGGGAVVSHDDAIDIVKKITGKDGLVAVVEGTNKVIDGLLAQRIAIDNKLAAQRMLLQLLIRLAKVWGVDKIVIGEEEVPEPVSPVSDDALDPETKDRMVKGLCLNKEQETKQWCKRLLKTKQEKDVGYCKQCQVRLGMIPLPVVSSIPKKKVEKKKAANKKR